MKTEMKLLIIFNKLYSSSFICHIMQQVTRDIHVSIIKRISERITGNFIIICSTNYSLIVREVNVSFYTEIKTQITLHLLYFFYKVYNLYFESSNLKSVK